LWLRVRPGWQVGDPAWRFGRSYISLGWPVLLANTGYGLVGAADRFAVSMTLPIYDFARYSLAASIMLVPVTAIASVYRVFFSHVAGVEQESRAKVYRHASKFVLALWSLSLPCYFAIEPFVRHFLPKYVPALPVAGVLMLGVLFLAGIQILHMSYFYLHGMQRQFLLQAAGALVVCLSLALAMTLWLGSLIAVAIGQVAALGLWWFANEWGVRRISGQGWKDWLRVLSVAGWSAACYGLALRLTPEPGWRVPIYYLLVVSALGLSCRDEFRLGLRLLQSSRGDAVVIQK
jgi:O-antigen/teichoic acid export membrane protein